MRKLLIYGHGVVYKKIKDYIDYQRYVIEGFVDTFHAGSDVFYEGLQCYYPNDVKQLSPDIVICASDEAELMERTLLGLDKECTYRIIKCTSDRIPFEEDVFDQYKVRSISEFNNLYRKLYDIESIMKLSLELTGTDWLSNLALSPGGWAIGPDLLLVLIKVLKYTKPVSILEFGLGQSSKVFYRFHLRFGGRYLCIEHDQEWVDFCMKESEVSREHIFLTNLQEEKTPYGMKYSYESINEAVKDEKYDLILIDGPFGSTRDSREDILKYIPECLMNSFCILIDDYDRIGERDMVEKLCGKLEKSGLHYVKKEYVSSKSFCIITSDNNHFLSSLL